MILQRTLTLSIIGLLGLSATAHAQPTPHGMGLIPSPQIQPALPMMVEQGMTEEATIAALPARVDLTRWAIEPGDQKEVNSCVGWAVGYTLAGWYANAYQQKTTKFAPMYVYSQINLGGSQYDGGAASASDALRLAIAQGIDTQPHYFQGAYDWKDKPTKDEYVNAGKYKPPYKSYTALFADFQAMADAS